MLQRQKQCVILLVVTTSTLNAKIHFGAGCMFEAGKDGQYRLIVGGVTGYKNQRVTPMLLPQYNIKIDDKAYFGVALIPPVKIADGGGLHFTFETRF